MPSHAETRVLPYTPAQLFDLVMDIEKYPEFLPWCTSAHIRARHAGAVEADVVIGYGPFSETFSSRVHFEKPSMIEVEYMRGPMRDLQTRWAFRAVKGGKTELSFSVDFSMKSRFLQVVIDQFFHLALARMIHAFEARAAAVYD